jgi:small subunit ribosomal protein S16
MLRIRLRRVGAKKQPSYRIVVAESTSPRDGKFVERIGFYNPRTEPETVTIKEERALYWLSVGAQPSDAVVRLFKNNGTLDRYERLKAGESLEDLVAEKAVEEEQAALKVEPELDQEELVAVAEEDEATEEQVVSEDVTTEMTDDTSTTETTETEENTVENEDDVA